MSKTPPPPGFGEQQRQELKYNGESLRVIAGGHVSAPPPLGFNHVDGTTIERRAHHFASTAAKTSSRYFVDEKFTAGGSSDFSGANGGTNSSVKAIADKRTTSFTNLAAMVGTGLAESMYGYSSVDGSNHGIHQQKKQHQSVVREEESTTTSQSPSPLYANDPLDTSRRKAIEEYLADPDRDMSLTRQSRYNAVRRISVEHTDSPPPAPAPSFIVGNLSSTLLTPASIVPSPQQKSSSTAINGTTGHHHDHHYQRQIHHDHRSQHKVDLSVVDSKGIRNGSPFHCQSYNETPNQQQYERPMSASPLPSAVGRSEGGTSTPVGRFYTVTSSLPSKDIGMTVSEPIDTDIITLGGVARPGGEGIRQEGEGGHSSAPPVQSSAAAAAVSKSAQQFLIAPQQEHHRVIHQPIVIRTQHPQQQQQAISSPAPTSRSNTQSGAAVVVQVEPNKSNIEYEMGQLSLQQQQEQQGSSPGVISPDIRQSEMELRPYVWNITATTGDAGGNNDIPGGESSNRESSSPPSPISRALVILLHHGTSQLVMNINDVRSTCEAFGVLEIFRSEFAESKGIIFVGYYDLRSAQYAALELKSCLKRLISPKSAMNAANLARRNDIDVQYCIPLNSSSAIDESIIVLTEVPTNIDEERMSSVLGLYGSILSLKRQSLSSYVVEFHNIQHAKQALLEVERAQPLGSNVMVEPGMRDLSDRKKGRDLLALIARWRKADNNKIMVGEAGAAAALKNTPSCTPEPIASTTVSPAPQSSTAVTSRAQAPSSHGSSDSSSPMTAPPQPESSSATSANPLGSSENSRSRSNKSSSQQTSTTTQLVLGPDGQYSYVIVKNSAGGGGSGVIPENSTLPYQQQQQHNQHYHHQPQVQQQIVHGPHGSYITTVQQQSSQLYHQSHQATGPRHIHLIAPSNHHQQQQTVHYYPSSDLPHQHHNTVTIHPQNGHQNHQYYDVATGSIVSGAAPPYVTAASVGSHTAGYHQHQQNISPLSSQAGHTTAVSFQHQPAMYAHVAAAPNPNDSSLSSGSAANSLMTQNFVSNTDDQLSLKLEAVESGADKRTSLMIRNIPNKYTQQMLLSEFTDCGFGPGIIDFFYLPIDFKNCCNRGYAFVNFVSYKDIVSFHRQYYGKTWKVFNSDKICDVTYARIQGKSGMLKRFENSALMDKEDGYKPLVFVSVGQDKGKRLPFPSTSIST